MEDKYINKILNFADKNINTAKELVINKEQAKGIIKELEQDYVPKAIINLTIAELKEKYNKVVNEINNQEVIDQLIDFKEVSAKLEMCEELLEKRG